MRGFVVEYYERLRGNLMWLVVFVWGRVSCVGLAGVGVLAGLCELLARSKLVIKSLRGRGYEPI